MPFASAEPALVRPYQTTIFQMSSVLFFNYRPHQFTRYRCRAY